MADGRDGLVASASSDGAIVLPRAATAALCLVDARVAWVPPREVSGLVKLLDRQREQHACGHLKRVHKGLRPPPSEAEGENITLAILLRIGGGEQCKAWLQRVPPKQLESDARIEVLDLLTARALPDAMAAALHAGLRLIDTGEYELLRKVHALVAWEPLTRDLELTTPRYCPSEPIIVAEALAALHAALDDLDPRERSVLEQRYGLRDQREHTLEEIGLLLGLTKERVRQIQINAETNLRALLVAKGWDGPPPVPVATLTLPDPKPKEPIAV